MCLRPWIRVALYRGEEREAGGQEREAGGVRAGWLISFQGGGGAIISRMNQRRRLIIFQGGLISFQTRGPLVPVLNTSRD